MGECDSIIIEYDWKEQEEEDRLNKITTHARADRDFKAKIATGEKPTSVRDLGYYYQLIMSDGEMLVNENLEEPKKQGIAISLVKNNKEYYFKLKSKINTGAYYINNQSIIDKMLKKVDGIYSVTLIIGKGELEDKNNPLNKLYKDFEVKNADFQQPFYIVLIIIAFIMCVLGVKFYERKIFVYYRKIKVEIWVILGLLTTCFVWTIRGTYFNQRLENFVNNNSFIMPSIIGFLAIVILSDIGYLHDIGFKQFIKERFGVFNKLVVLVRDNINTSNSSVKKIKIFSFIIFTIIYHFVSLKLVNYFFYLIWRDFSIGVQMLIIYYSTILIYLGYKFIKLNQELRQIEKATENIANGKFNIKFEKTKTKKLDNIRKNLSNIDKGFKIAIDDEIKSERMKSELITNVSHDLKTPLTSIINYVDLLQRDNLTDKDKEQYVRILDNKSKRLKVLIEDLFEAAKASTGNIELNIEKINIVSVLRQTMGEFTEKIESEKLDFKVNIPDHKIILDLDGARMWRVFENLIANTLKYSLEGTRVYIDLKETDSEVIFEIKNISGYELNCDVNELKERFKRADISRNTEGSGLGLSIANSLVELQGGRLDINIDGDLFKVKVSFKK